MIYSVTFAAHDYGFYIHTETTLFSDYEQARKRTEAYILNGIVGRRDEDETLCKDCEHAISMLNLNKHDDEFVYNITLGSEDFRVVLTPHENV